MKHQTPQLLKFKRAQRRLGLAKARDLIGLLEALWHLTIREAPRGDIGKLDNEAIAIELEWDGEPAHLIEVLTTSGWLNEDPEHRLLVHNWPKHAPRFVHGICKQKGGFAVQTKAAPPTAKTAENAAAAPCGDAAPDCKQPTTVPDYSAPLQSPPTVPPCSEVQPNVTKPNVTKETNVLFPDEPSGDAADSEQPKPPLRPGVGKCPRDYWPEFDGEHSIWPLWRETSRGGKNKRQSWVAWWKAMATLYRRGKADPARWLLQRARLYVRSADGQGPYAPLLSTWLNGERFDEDPTDWNKTPRGNGSRAQQQQEANAAALSGFLGNGSHQGGDSQSTGLPLLPQA